MSTCFDEGSAMPSDVRWWLCPAAGAKVVGQGLRPNTSRLDFTEQNEKGHSPKNQKGRNGGAKPPPCISHQTP